MLNDARLILRRDLLKLKARTKLPGYRRATHDMKCGDPRHALQSFEKLQPLVDRAIDHGFGQPDLDRLGDRDGMSFRHVERKMTERPGGNRRDNHDQQRHHDAIKNKGLGGETHGRALLAKYDWIQT